MGKRLMIPLAAAAAAALLAGCSGMQHIDNGSSTAETQPVTTASTQTTTAPPPATTAAPVTTMSPEQAVQVCSEQELLALGASLYDDACNMLSAFRGAVYPTDPAQTAERPSDQATGQLVTDDTVHTPADVQAAFDALFTEDIPYKAEDYYFAWEGGLYAVVPAAQPDTGYMGTELTGAKVQGTRVDFTAVSYYTDPETGEDRAPETAVFSVIAQENGWKTAALTLPY